MLILIVAEYALNLFLSIRSPQHKHDVLALRGDNMNHLVRKLLPAALRVRIGLVSLHRQHCVQQQNTLPGPRCQVREASTRHAQIRVNFRVNISQRRRHRLTFPHTKRQTVRLTFIVVRILPENEYAHVLQMARHETRKNFMRRRVNRPQRAFLRQPALKLMKACTL